MTKLDLKLYQNLEIFSVNIIRYLYLHYIRILNIYQKIQ